MVHDCNWGGPPVRPSWKALQTEMEHSSCLGL